MSACDYFKIFKIEAVISYLYLSGADHFFCQTTKRMAELRFLIILTQKDEIRSEDNTNPILANFISPLEVLVENRRAGIEADQGCCGANICCARSTRD